MIQDWIVHITPTTSGQKIFEKCDLQSYSEKRKEYDLLTKTEKSGYKGADDFIIKNGGPALTQENKNYKLLSDEINAQLASESMPELFPIEFLDHDVEVQDLLSSLENENHIKDIYRKKKLQVKNSGINTQDAAVLMDCIRQGRSLLQAGLKAEMLAKPLIDFYAASAYAYAIIVLNSPLHKSIASLKGSHGHTYNHLKKTVDFGGDIPSGTFSDLLCALPVAKISQIGTQNISFKYSALPSIDLAQRNSISLSLLPLLSMVPELGAHFDQLNSGHKSVHKLNIDTGINGSKFTYNFYIGDGINRPAIDKIKNCFRTEDVTENQGSYKVSVDSSVINSILPTIYQDLYGQLWYVESPIEGLYLPEICLHCLIISALCNIMRYSPREWSNILTNRISSQFALVINQYIRIFERKFPLLAAQCLSNYNPVLK